MWTIDQTRQRLEDGHDVCPVGQLSPAARAWLRRETKEGRLFTVASDWPDRRPAWRSVRAAQNAAHAALAA